MLAPFKVLGVVLLFVLEAEISPVVEDTEDVVTAPFVVKDLEPGLDTGQTMPGAGLAPPPPPPGTPQIIL